MKKKHKDPSFGPGNRVYEWLREQDKKPSLLMRGFYTSMAAASVVAMVGGYVVLPILLAAKAVASAWKRSEEDR